MTDKPYLLYIEDERPVIELVRLTLQTDRLEVIGVTSAADGLAMMRRRRPELLLLDLMMPDLNGWDVYRAMKADPTLADIPVIVITSKVPDTGHLIVPDLPQVDDYITKPFSVARLIRAVQNVLASRAE